MNEATQRSEDARWLRNLAWAMENSLDAFTIYDVIQLRAIADRIAGQSEDDGSNKTYWYACCGIDVHPVIGVVDVHPYTMSQAFIEPLNSDGSPTLPDTWPGSGPFLNFDDAWAEAERFARQRG